MTVLESLGVDVFGFAIVFVVLIALSLVIKLISMIISSVQKKKSVALPETQSTALQEYEGTQYADGELRLFDVDEKTAALIMAIVSDEAGIPLSQLRFQSIRLMK